METFRATPFALPAPPHESNLMATNQEFYLARAAEARADANAANLDNVRDRCIRSALAWEDMAARAGRTDRMRAELDAKKAAEHAALQDG